jgi:hypothetical protein
MINLRKLKEILWNPKQKKSYKIVKYVSIVFGHITLPLDFYIALMWDDGKILMAVILFATLIILGIVDNIAWVWCMEEMAKDKVKHGKRTRRKKQ